MTPEKPCSASGAAGRTSAVRPESLLCIRDLHVHFHTREGDLRALEGVSMEIARGEILGVVGESGCGKSITAASVLRILPENARIAEGTILFDAGEEGAVDMAQLDPRGARIRAIRGRDISMVFQEPMTAFSPVHTIGNQITEMIRLHSDPGKAEARERAVRELARVGMPKPEQRIDAYPFQLSGGMRQRAMIAMALACRPKLLIADEPTTALDVTIEAQILELIRRLQEDSGMAVMIITHDLSVVAEMSHRVLVMYLGQDVECAPAGELFRAPRHPYTRELLASIPRLGHKPGGRLHTIPGAVPSLYERPAGCPFHPRCPEAMEGICDQRPPPMTHPGPGRRVRCFLYA